MYEEFIDSQRISTEAEYSRVYKYLDRYKFDKAGDRQTYNESIKKNKTIWILWLQGMENAPQIVRRCYESITKFKPEGYDITLLTIQNLEKYITLPDYIMDKYYCGLISNTHFSDIIRLELLYIYGGLWIDATVYICDKVPEFMYSGDFFAFDNSSVTAASVIKMSSWWIYACANNCIISKTRDMIYTYWQQENQLINYFLLHIAMSKVIDEHSKANRIFKFKYFYSNGNAHYLQGNLAAEYDEKKWNYIKFISPIQKLSYKRKYLLGDIASFYVVLIEEKF